MKLKLSKKHRKYLSEQGKKGAQSRERMREIARIRWARKRGIGIKDMVEVPDDPKKLRGMKVITGHGVEVTFDPAELDGGIEITYEPEKVIIDGDVITKIPERNIAIAKVLIPVISL